jgi:hypothetical protein
MLLCFLFGAVMIVQFFIPHPWSQEFHDWMVQKGLIVMGGFGFVIGVGTFLNMHVLKIRRKVEGWAYSMVALIGLVLMAAAGVFGGLEEGTLCHKMYLYLFSPMQATMFSLLAFFIASACYRAFRARTLEATLMLLAAIVVMLGRVPFGDLISGGAATPVTEWLLKVPNMASKRAIMLGVSLGIIATSLKVMVGIERSWLGGTGGD